MAAIALGALAQEIGARLEGAGGRQVRRVADLRAADGDSLSFYVNKRYRGILKETRAAAVILAAGDAADCPAARLIVADPYLAYARAAHLLNPPPEHRPGVHPTAVIETDAQAAPDCFVGANAVVGQGAIIGAGAWVGAGCFIGAGAVVGPHCRLQAGVVLLDGARLGARVLLHPGVVIGADGYGFAANAGQWLKIPQAGGVVIGDDVEIGSNTTVDRGALGDTVIESGVKIDSQVLIGHNVHIGEHTAIAGAAVFAGSVKIGKRCMIGGASAVAGHIEIADDVTITGASAVSNDIRQAGVYSSGMPATDNNAWRKNMARLKRLDEFVRRLLALEKRQNDHRQADER